MTRHWKPALEEPTVRNCLSAANWALASSREGTSMTGTPYLAAVSSEIM